MKSSSLVLYLVFYCFLLAKIKARKQLKKKEKKKKSFHYQGGLFQTIPTVCHVPTCQVSGSLNNSWAFLENSRQLWAAHHLSTTLELSTGPCHSLSQGTMPASNKISFLIFKCRRSTGYFFGQQSLAAVFVLLGIQTSSIQAGLNITSMCCNCLYYPVRIEEKMKLMLTPV